MTKTFELNGKSYQVRRPTLGIVKEIERRYGKESEQLRNMAIIQRCLHVEAGNSGAYRAVTEVEFDNLSVDELAEIQRQQDGLAPLDVRVRLAAADLADILPANAPAGFLDYLVGLALDPKEAEENPLS